MLKNIKIVNKFILTFLIISVLFIASIALLLDQNKSVMNDLDYFYKHPYIVTNTTQQIKTDLLGIRVAVKNILLLGNYSQSDPYIKTINDNFTEAQTAIDLLKNTYLGDNNQIVQLDSSFHVWIRFELNLLDSVKNGDIAGATKASINNGDIFNKDLFDQMDAIIAFAHNKADSFYTDAGKVYTSSRYFSYLALIIVLIVSAMLVIILTRNISDPIIEINNAINKVENGEDTVNITNINRKDELGKVAGAFNNMLVYLKTKRELNELNLTLAHQKTLELFRVTLMSIGDGVLSADNKGNVVNMNPVAEKLTGWTFDEAKGRPLFEIFNIVNSRTRAKCENLIEKVLKNGETVGLGNDTLLLSRTGASYNISDSAAPIRDANGELSGVVLTFRDISEEYKKQEEIMQISFHDKLTGLYNRAFFEEEIKRMNVGRQMPLSIIMADINGLKLINDTFGHHQGDKYLIAAANALKSCCRAEDVIARWGGDEFVILLPKTTSENSQQICTRIISTYASISGFKIKPSIAVGYAVQEKVQKDYQDTLKSAETNMYRHKLLDSDSIRSAIVASLDSSMAERYLETEEHEKALVELSEIIGIQLGMKDNERNDLKLLAKLHDIGKIAISDSILLKPDKLDLEEWIEMKRHVEIGYRIAKSTPSIEHIAEGILSHHERWDGSGYPRGLAGEAIPFHSRIIAVADAYNAMTKGRVYKKAISHDEAIQELMRCSGTQFDPAIVQAFIKAVHSQDNGD